jgi:hypothetical protein
MASRGCAGGGGLVMLDSPQCQSITRNEDLKHQIDVDFSSPEPSKCGRPDYGT